jgi:hypothetical protein
VTWGGVGVLVRSGLVYWTGYRKVGFSGCSDLLERGLPLKMYTAAQKESTREST